MNSLISLARRHYLVILVIIIIAVLTLGYAAGYRPGPGLTIVKVGTLTVTDIPPGTNVYTDLSSRGTSKGSSLSVILVPGTHTVITDAPNEEPVENVVTIISNETTTLSPILVSERPGEVDLNAADKATESALIAKTSMPTEAAPLSLGCAIVYVANNRVIAEAATGTPACATPPEYLCTGGTCAPTIVYAPVATIHSVIPLPGRTDAIAVATGEWVYAVGLNPTAPYQFFAPLMHGFSPLIAPGPGSGNIYVKDQSSIFGVSF